MGSVKKIAKKAISPIASVHEKVLGDPLKKAWGDVTGATAAEKAARAQSEAAKSAEALQWQMYQQSRADVAPWREAGEKALGILEERVAAGPGEYTEDPGYQFRLQQGLEQIQTGRGNIRSGATEKALQRYAQDYATGDYQNFLNRYYQSLPPLQSLAGVGQQAGAQQAQMAQQTGPAVGQLRQQAGAAKASGYIDKYNAYKGFLGSAAQMGAMAYGAGMFGGGAAAIPAGGAVPNYSQVGGLSGFGR